jgi:hypothetical protein
MMQYEDDPLFKLINGIHKMADELNHNLESFKVIVSVQHTHNACFLNDISDLNHRVSALERERLTMEGR